MWDMAIQKKGIKKNVLMKALGAAINVDVDISECDMDMNIREVLLCSDGLTNMLTVDQMEKVLNDNDLDIEEQVDKLIMKANTRGGNDNITIAYARMSGE